MLQEFESVQADIDNWQTMNQCSQAIGQIFKVKLDALIEHHHHKFEEFVTAQDILKNSRNTPFKQYCAGSTSAIR